MLGDAGLDWYRVLGLRPPPFALGLLGGLGPRLADLGLGGGGGTGPAVSNAQVKQGVSRAGPGGAPGQEPRTGRTARAFELLQVSARGGGGGGYMWGLSNGLTVFAGHGHTAPAITGGRVRRGARALDLH